MCSLAPSAQNNHPLSLQSQMVFGLDFFLFLFLIVVDCSTTNGQLITLNLKSIRYVHDEYLLTSSFDSCELWHSD